MGTFSYSFEPKAIETMENKFYADQSTVFDHINKERRHYSTCDSESQTLKMKKVVMAAAMDVVIILCILMISFYII